MRFRSHSDHRRLTALVALALLAGVPGCSSGRYPVTGRVMFEDGSPLGEGVVICERQDGERPAMARATLAPDGTFSLGTERPGDGARPGKYRVLVGARELNDREAAIMPPFIDPKWTKFETSGLELEVKPGKNELNITVTKPKNWRRGRTAENHD